MKNRKQIEVGGPRAIFFEFEREKIKFGVQKLVLRTQLSPQSKGIEIFGAETEKHRKCFEMLAGDGGARDD